MDKLSGQLFVQIPQPFASQATQMESLAVLFIQLLAVRRNHPFGSCNNIGTICGNDTKSILAQWSICLMHPSQPVWLTNVRLGKIEWKENKKKMSVVCCHCSNKPSLTGVIVRRHAQMVRGRHSQSFHALPQQTNPNRSHSQTTCSS